MLSRAIALTCLLGYTTLPAWALSKAEEAIRERIKPVGEVCVEGDNCATQTVASIEGSASGGRSAEEIVQTSCFACHGTGAAGAPKIGDKAAWEPRVAKGMDMLLKNAIKGINAMPPKGTCMTCSDADIKAAIEYMTK